MNREFIQNLIFLVFINLLVKPLYIFGVDVGVQNATGADYGLFFALFNFSYLMQFIADLGIQQYNNRVIAQDNQNIHSLFPQFLFTKMLLILPYMGIAFLFCWLINLTDNWWLLAIVLFNQVLISFSMFIRSNVSGLGMYRKDSILSIVDKLFMIIVCGYLLIGPGKRHGFNILTFALLQSASFLMTIIIGSFFLRGRQLFAHFDWSFQKIKPLLIKSIPFGITVLLMTMYTRIDAVMIKSILPNGAEEAQVYAGGYRLLDAANMFAFLFAPLLLPMFSKLHDKPELRQKLFNLSLSLMWVITIVVSMSCWVHRQEIMQLLYTDADLYWGRVFGALILNFIWMGLIYILGTYITAGGRMKEANITFLVCIIINIVLNAYLIPDTKAWGAAVATLITHGLVVMGLIWITRRTIFHRSNIQNIGLFLVFAGGVVGVHWVVDNLDGIHWIIRMSMAILASLIIAFSIRLLDITALRKELATIKRGR